MFKRHQEPEAVLNNEGMEMVATGDVTALQINRDVKEEATRVIDDAFSEFVLEGAHPWQADDHAQVRLSLAMIALYNDRFAEVLAYEGAATVDARPVLPKDMQYFAERLSQIALDGIDQVKELAHSRQIGQSLEYGDGWLEALQPEAQLPYWPIFATENGAQAWQGDETTSVFGLSTGFLRATVRAGMEMQADSAKRLSGIVDMAEVPDKFTDLPGIINDFLETGRAQLESATGYLDSPALSANIKARAYQKAHDGYITTALAAVAIVGPQILGPDWSPED